MRLKIAALASSLSLLCLLSPTAARAAGITVGTDYFMTVFPYSSGENNGSFYVGDTTIKIYADNSGSQGALLATYLDAFCVDFLDEISVPTTYLVVTQGVGSTYSNSVGGPASSTVQIESALGYQFSGTVPNDANVQEAIWDYSGASYSSAAITADISTANSYTGGFAGDFDFEEINHDGQSFMVDLPQPPPQSPPPAVPEPSSLMLLGTGMFGVVGIMRRKLQKA